MSAGPEDEHPLWESRPEPPLLPAALRWWDRPDPPGNTTVPLLARRRPNSWRAGVMLWLAVRGRRRR